jgi:hypothetical protein
MYMEVPIMKLTHILILILVAAALVFTGCFSAGTGGGGSVDYKVEFKLDGTQYSLTGGYNDLSGPPEGAYQSYELATYTLMYATPAGASDHSEFLKICIPGTETGTYWDADPGSFGWDFDYDGVFYEADPDENDFSISLTRIEPVGGVIEGTFSGTASTPNDTSDGTYSITDGFFRVKRLADDALPSDD